MLDDADMDTAVRVAVEGMFYNQGEACTSTARLLVHSSRAGRPGTNVLSQWVSRQ